MATRRVFLKQAVGAAAAGASVNVTADKGNAKPLPEAPGWIVP